MSRRRTSYCGGPNVSLCRELFAAAFLFLTKLPPAENGAQDLGIVPTDKCVVSEVLAHGVSRKCANGQGG